MKVSKSVVSSFKKVAGARSLDQILLDSGKECFLSIKNHEGYYVACNKAFRDYVGVESDDFILGKKDFDLFPNRELCYQFWADDQDVMESGKVSADNEEFIENRNGLVRHLLTTRSPVLGKDGEIIGVSVVSRDITILKEIKASLEQKQQELEQLSITDSITGAYNNRFLNRELPIIYNAFGRSGKAVSLLMLDIDNFHEINKSYGHATGDRILKYFGVGVRKVLRRKEDLFIRIGGDEFLVMLFGAPVWRPQNMGGQKTAEELAMQIQQEIRKLEVEPKIQAQQGKIQFTLSVGLVENNPQESLNSLIRRADEALFKAKADGKDQIYIGSMRPPQF
jgi:diguanylate cyclase (GGDEF)-like protein/PAS domain S-box-containing protein